MAVSSAATVSLPPESIYVLLLFAYNTDQFTVVTEPITSAVKVNELPFFIFCLSGLIVTDVTKSALIPASPGSGCISPVSPPDTDKADIGSTEDGIRHNTITKASKILKIFFISLLLP